MNELLAITTAILRHYQHMPSLPTPQDVAAVLRMIRRLEQRTWGLNAKGI